MLGLSNFSNRLYLDAEAGTTYFIRLANRRSDGEGRSFRLNILDATSTGLNPDNLLQNPDAETERVNGVIPGWTVVAGDSWTYRKEDPDGVFRGSNYLFPGNVSEAELSQDVDVSAFAADIDAGKQQFTFGGFVRSFPQTPADEARIVVEYRDEANAVVLDSFDTGPRVTSDRWEMLTDTRLAPAGARFVRVRLLATRRAGDENNAYFDELSLVTETFTAPPPENVTITVTAEGEASAREAQPISVEMTGSFAPTERLLFFRRGRESVYQQLPLQPNGALLTATIPADFVTARGIDYYALLTDGTNTITYPVSSPETNPAHLRVRLSQVSSPVAPPPGAYRMISIPFELDDPDPARMLEDDYGPYDPQSWRLLRWNPTTEAYEDLPDLATGLSRGRAFWLASLTGNGFDVNDGTSALPEPFSLTLTPGWNQIGDPYAFPIDWSDVSTDNGVETPVFWDGAAFQYNQTVLEPWEGYFVFNNTADAVTLTFQPFAAVAAGKTTVAESATYRIFAEASVPDLGLRDDYNVFGVLEASTAPKTTTEAPPVGKHVRLSLIGPDRRRLAADLQPLRKDGHVWDFELGLRIDDKGEAGSHRVEVALEESGTRPDGFEIYVFDRDRRERLPLRADRFTVALRAGEIRHFRLVLGTESFAADAGEGAAAPRRFALEPAYPNPFTDTVILPYQVGRSGRATLSIYNMLGQRVLDLVAGEQTPGVYEARWDGSDRAGRPAPSGLYFYRLVADGFSATRPVVLVR
ncbi:T9SS type A sorting domain-containing protein [Rhodocaloribacter sp.]